MSSPVGQTGLAEYSLALRAGTMLADQYTIVGVLGRPGGFGITYLAEDIRLESLVAIKEFLPRELATRAPDSTAVITHAGDTDGGFRHGLEQFLREARTLAKIHHPSVVRVRQFFEANGTAYLVMDYLEGETLNDLLKEQGGRIPAFQAVEIINRVLDGLRAAHALNIYHRDVKPSNIYITSSGLPVLLDFGAARQATGATSSKMTAVLTPGFAPLEQYGHRGQGPWTDIYAAAAVLYHAITGVDPVTATERVGEEIDPMLPPVDIDPDIGQPLSDAIMKGLAMQARNRPQSADEFQKLLTAAVAATRAAEAETSSDAPLASPLPPAVEPIRPRPTPSGPPAPFVPALADTLGPADLASPEPLRRSSSGSTPVLPVVPSLADTLGPGALPHPDLPPTLPPSHAEPPLSAPSLANTVAFVAPRRSTPPATPEVSATPPVAAPGEPSSREEPSSLDEELGQPPSLSVSDAFKRPPDVEVALRPVAESDMPSGGSRSSDPVNAAAVDDAVAETDWAPSESTVVDDVDESVSDRPWSPDAVPIVPDDSAPASGGRPGGGGGGGGARQLWTRATDTRNKRIALAALGLTALVVAGTFLATPNPSQPVATATPDSATKVSTGETTPLIDSAAIRDSLAALVQDSINLADSLKAVAAAAKTKDSLARLAAAQRAAGAARGTGRGEQAARGGATAYQDSVKPAEAATAQQGSAAALAAAAEDHLRTAIDEFVNVLRSGNEGAIAGALGESERSAESRASLMKFLRDRSTNIESVTPADISWNGDTAQRYFTVKFTWREGRIRRSTHSDYAVFRASARHAGGKWTYDKPEITRAPEAK